MGRNAEIPHVTFTPVKNRECHLIGFLSKKAIEMFPYEYMFFSQGLRTIRPGNDNGIKVSCRKTFSITTDYPEELIGKWNVELNGKGELQLFRD